MKKYISEKIMALGLTAGMALGSVFGCGKYINNAIEDPKTYNFWGVNYTDDDPGVSEIMDISVGGIDVGKQERIDVSYKGLKVAEIYADGKIRLKPYNTSAFGTSLHMGPSYWETLHGVEVEHSKTKIDSMRIDFKGSSHDPNFKPEPVKIRAAGKQDNFGFTASITLSPPESKFIGIDVEENLTCTKDFSVSMAKQNKQEGFRLMSLSSLFMDTVYHTSDSATYTGLAGRRQEEYKNLFSGAFGLSKQFIFSTVEKMGDNWVEAVQADDAGFFGNTPNLSIEISKPPFGECSAQGSADKAVSTASDNILLWINQDTVSGFKTGDTATIKYKTAASDNPMK